MCTKMFSLSVRRCGHWRLSTFFIYITFCMYSFQNNQICLRLYSNCSINIFEKSVLLILTATVCWTKRWIIMYSMQYSMLYSMFVSGLCPSIYANACQQYHIYMRVDDPCFSQYVMAQYFIRNCSENKTKINMVQKLNVYIYV